MDLKWALTYEIAYKKLKSFESFTLEWTRKGTEFLCEAEFPPQRFVYIASQKKKYGRINSLKIDRGPKKMIGKSARNLNHPPLHSTPFVSVPKQSTCKNGGRQVDFSHNIG
jgi:hypothetical protein